MNLERYEKIDGWQALKRLKDGERVTREVDGMFFHFERIADLIFEKESHENRFDPSDIVLNDLLEYEWYIPKPFDVRQAMFERPNEWVGALEFEGAWYKVGFDTVQFMSVSAPINGSESVDERIYGVTRVVRDSLDDCIPIEDAPEEATR